MTTNERIVLDTIYVFAGLVVGAALAAMLAGCHLADAIQDLRTSGNGAALVGAIPGAVAGNPVSWYTIASILTGFVGTAVVGHRAIAGRWPFQKSPSEIAADVVSTVVKDLVPTDTVISSGPPPEKPN